MTDPTYIDRIAQLGACDPALAWLREQQYPTLADAWAACPRGDWLLWLYGRTAAGEPWSDERKLLVRAAVAVAREALPIFEARRPADRRVRACLDAAEAWTRGEATPGQVRRARRDAAFVADAAANVADVVAAAADAAAANVAYADAAYVAAAYAQSLARSAATVRSILTCPAVPETS